MLKIKFCLLLIFISAACFGQEIDKKNLISHLRILSSDQMEGRAFGAAGGEKAADYIAANFKTLGLQPAYNADYLQPFTHTFKGKELGGSNIVALIPGASDEVIVITAHYDHLGIKGNKIYNGADDNASGTAALFSIGQYFLKNKPDHTLVLAAVDAEEIGSIGAQYLLDNFPLYNKDIVLNINLDMIAHNDKNELYATGTYFYPQLKEPLKNLNSSIDLRFGHDSPKYVGADNWTYSSDHRVFHKKNIPFVYFGVEDHEDYHKPSDVFENINQEFYINAVTLVINAIVALDKSL